MKHVFRLRLPGAVLVLMLAVHVPPSYAQVAAVGAIVGTVTDATGAVVPDAEVTVTNEALQQKRTAQSNAQGFYAIESLLAATYELTVKKTGFQTFSVQSVAVDPGCGCK